MQTSGVFRLQEMKRERQNEQMKIYLFVLIMYLLIFWIGLLGCSLFWVFVIAFATFSLWKRKVFSLTERYIKEKETILHRKKALRQSETCEWLNFIVNRWLVFCSSTISEVLKRKIDPFLQHLQPYFLSCLELKSLNIDSKTPYFRSVQAFEVGEGGRRPIGWDGILSPPSGLKLAQKYQVVVEGKVELMADKFMELVARLAGTWLGLSLEVSIERMEMSASVQMVLHFDTDVPFPHVSSVSMLFTEKPNVHFNVRVLRHIQLMEIPLLKFWIHSLITNILTEALVDPGRVEFDFSPKGSLPAAPSQITSLKLALGVLRVSVSGSYKAGEKKRSKPTMNILELISDTRYCVVSVGDQESLSSLISGSSPFNHSATFLIYSLSEDKVNISLNSKVFLTNQCLASSVLLLSKYPLDHKRSIEETVDHFLDRTNETMKLSTKLEYMPLPSWDTLVHGGPATTPDNLKWIKSGVVNICIHGASDLMGLDSDGLSDPYCIVYNKGKKLLCTHYVPHTRNPCWEVFSQFIVEDINKVMLSFVVYDWDGGSTNDDDFLGSAHIIMTQELHKLIYQTYSLDANLLPVGESTSNKGTIIISVVFVPVENISTLSRDTTPDQISQYSSLMWASGTHQNIPSLQSNSKLSQLASDEILIINIIQAADLIAKDRNGLSDPFCGVYVGRQRKFLTNVKKETLNPVWNEQCTIEMPKDDETLHILLWDHDLLSKNDFLGRLDFSRKQLIELGSNAQHDGWFKLEKVEIGRIQLKFQVFTQELDHPSTPRKSSSFADNSDAYLHALINEASQKSIRETARVHDGNQGLKVLTNDVASSHSSRLNGGPPQSSSSKSLNNESKLSKHFQRGLERLSAFVGQKKSNLNPGPSTSNYQLFVGIRIEVTSIVGLPPSSARFYCKVKLHSVIDRRKKPIARSSRFVSTGNILMDFNFNVDKNHGESKMSSLIISIKSNPFSTLIEKSFKLQEVLPNEAKKRQECILDLNGVKLSLHCSYERNQHGYNLSSGNLK